MNLETRDVSEGSFLAEFPGLSDSDANRAAVSLAERLSSRRSSGVLDAIPGARTLFVLFDPRARDSAGIVRQLRRLAAERETASLDVRLFRIPVAYGGPGGPDLLPLARDRGIDPEELCRRHARAEYRVAFLGFSPGFAYLTGLPPELASPRLESPRPRVPAGSVAIGGDYTAIYPSETPGGWRLIGRSSVALFDPAAEPPALLRPGDRVSFEPIAEDELLRRLAKSRAAERREERGEKTVFEVVTPGLFTSIQGVPRFGLGRSGVPAGGAMDLAALERGNLRLGNPAGAPALEVTLSGPELLLRADALLSLAGADLDARWNGSPAPFDAAFAARAGDRLSFGRARNGARAYLCVAGGLAARRAGEPTRRLARGELVARARSGRPPGIEPSLSAGRPDADGGVTLRALPGPQADVLGAGASDLFFSATYRVSPESDRRGIRLDGQPLSLRRAPDVPPEGTALGAIQVPANGLPIVLGPDRPVTGGYAKIATVIARDWALLAQALPGTAIRFRSVTLSEAKEELRRTEAGSR